MKDTSRLLNMKDIPLRWRHVCILLIASVGQALGGMLAILVGVIVPLIAIIRHPVLPSWVQGVLCASGLIGIMFGSLLFGRLSDKFGYLFFFRLCPLLVTGASLLVYFFPTVMVLVVCLLLIGIAIGGSYALDPSYLSEIMPEKWRRTMLGISKAMSGVGNIIMIFIAYLVLKRTGNPADWHTLFLVLALLAVLTFLARFWFVESPAWLLAHGRQAEAECNLRHFLGQDVYIGDAQPTKKQIAVSPVSRREFFSGKNIKRIILSGVPWGCEGMGVYGIGIFTPILLLTLGLIQRGEDPFEKVLESLRYTFYINLFVMFGFILGLSVVRRYNLIKSQFWGFVLSAAGLAITWMGYVWHAPAGVLLAGFLLFELALNAGPHLSTFELPSRIYSLQERAEGEGIASALGKLGAIIATFVIPLLLDWGGGGLVLMVAVAVLLCGGIITRWFGFQVLNEKNNINK
ncbi:MAG: MFS transporter [Odoribacter sp.]|nr:MFS transporter [Odoribacter sp.]